MYCSIEQFVNRFDLNELIQLTDSSGTGTFDSAVINAAITDASNLIDGYLGGRYALPLAVIPAALVGICANLARYNLYDNVITPVVERNHKSAIDFLTAVGKGQLRLGLSEDAQQPESDEMIVMESAGSVFNRKDSKGFI